MAKSTRRRATPRDINARAFTALVRYLDALVSKTEEAQAIIASAHDAACEWRPGLDYQSRLHQQRTVRKLASVMKRGELLRNHALLYKAELEHLASHRGETS